MTLLSAQRVRGKVRAAVKRREDQIETEEMEAGELNLIPYLDIVTNLNLFLLASVSAGLTLTQIDTTLPDKGPPQVTQQTPATNPNDMPLKLFVSIKRDEMILWSATGLEGTLSSPKPGYVFKRVGRAGEVCDGNYMCETNRCDDKTLTCAAVGDAIAPVFEWRRFNDTLVNIAQTRYGGRPRKPDTYTIVLQADQTVPYGTIVNVMAALRCKLPPVGKSVQPCILPTDDPKLHAASNPVTDKLYDTTRAVYDPQKMALFHDIQFSAGFEKF